MKIGLTELLVIFIVALVVIGPDKLPAYSKKLGEALRMFKKYSSEATKEIRESVVEPLEEAQRPLREAMEPITDLQKSVQGDVNDIKKSFSNVGKNVKAKEEAVKTDAAGTAEAAADTAEDAAGTAEAAADTAEDAAGTAEAAADITEAAVGAVPVGEPADKGTAVNEDSALAAAQTSGPAESFAGVTDMQDSGQILPESI